MILNILFLMLGVMIGVVFMCIVQINRTNNDK